MSAIPTNLSFNAFEFHELKTTSSRGGGIRDIHAALKSAQRKQSRNQKLTGTDEGASLLQEDAYATAMQRAGAVAAFPAASSYGTHDLCAVTAATLRLGDFAFAHPKSVLTVTAGDSEASYSIAPDANDVEAVLPADVVAAFAAASARSAG